MNVKSTFLLFVLLIAVAVGVSAQDPDDVDVPTSLQLGDHGSAFVHTTNLINVDSSLTTLFHPLLNGNPNAILFVTHQNFMNDSSEYVGVWYDESIERWRIYNQNSNVTMGLGLRYDVQILSPSESVFQVKIPNGWATYIYPIDHPLLNNNPLAQIQITSAFTYNGISDGNSVNRPIAVDYHEISGKWHIVATDSIIPINGGAIFNVQIVSAASRDLTFIHTATDRNTFGGYTLFDHSLLNSNPNAQMLVTPIINAYNNGLFFTAQDQIALDYNGSEWGLYHPNGDSIPVGSQFLVTVVNTFNQTENPVANAGFEVGAVDANGKPHSWNAVGNVKRTCNRLTKGKIVSYEAYCAAQITGGNGAKSSLTQNLSAINRFDAGEDVYIGARVMGKNVSSGVSMIAILNLLDGTKAKVKIPASNLLGSYSYKPVKGVSNAPLTADATQVRVRLMHKGTGSLFVDAIYLSDGNLSGVFSTPELETLPLPEAAN